MSELKSGRFGDTFGCRRTKPAVFRLGASRITGADGPCPTAHAGKLAIMQVAIRSSARVEIRCQPSNIKMRLSEDPTEMIPFVLPSPDSGQGNLSRSSREMVTQFRMRASRVMANTVRRTNRYLFIPFFWPPCFGKRDLAEDKSFSF